MKKKIILFLLALLTLCAAGCAKTAEAEQIEDDSVELSNILFPGDPMSPKQKKLLEAVGRVLEEAAFDVQGHLKAENTTGEALDIRFMAEYLDADGNCVGWGSMSLDEWPAGGRLDTALPNSMNTRLHASALLGAEVTCEGAYLRTAFLPAASGENDVELVTETELPIRIKSEGSCFLVTEFSFAPAGRTNSTTGKPFYTGTLLMEKEAGEDGAYENFGFRIVGKEDRVVYYSGWVTATGMQTGDRYRNAFYRYAELEPGVYVLEFIADSVTGGAAKEEAKPPAEDTPAAAPEPEETEKPSDLLYMRPQDDDKAWKAEVEKAEKLMEEGEYYEAAKILTECSEAHPDAKDTCEADLEKIRKALAGKEPQTGELERTIQYQGAHEVRLTAWSGPLEVTIKDVDHPNQYVRFYVRHYETSLIYLVSGTYEISYKIGSIWFGDEIGFGELCTEGGYKDYLDVHTKQEGGWITNYRWSDII